MRFRPLQLAVVAGFALMVQGAVQASPSFVYRVSGQFLTASGPGKPPGGGISGFNGSIRWDPSLNVVDSVPMGGWSEWIITTYINGTAGFTWSSSSGGASCFSSPFSNFNSGSYSYSHTDPGGADCMGGQVGGLASPWSPVPYSQTVPGQPDVINLYSPGSYTWTNGGTYTSQAQWFRVPVKAATDFATTGNLSFDPVKNNQQNYQAGWFAWDATISDLDAGLAGTQGSCSGTSNGTAATTPDICPFMGNSQYRSGLGSPVVVVEIDPGPGPIPPPDPFIPTDAPAPLGWAGLASGLAVSRRLRIRRTVCTLSA